MTLRVVYDAALLVAANAFADPDAWEDWPNVPPVSDHPEQDCLGIIASSPKFGGDVALVTHRSVLSAVLASLKDDVGLEEEEAGEFLMALIRMATDAGQAPIADADLVPSKGLQGHHADVVGLAEGPRGGRLVVSADPQLLGQADLLKQRGVVILPPDEFARRVDMQRRAQMLDG